MQLNEQDVVDAEDGVDEVTDGAEDCDLAPEEKDAGASEAKEDCEPKNVAPDPGMPSRSEVDDHDVDHLPFGSWCECCVRGKAIGEHHHQGVLESSIAIVAIDYMFIMREKIGMRHELTEEDHKNMLVKILVVKDSKTGASSPMAMPYRGWRKTWRGLGTQESS